MPSTPVPLNPGHGIDISWMQFHRDARNRVASSAPGNNTTTTITPKTTTHSQHLAQNLTINTNSSSKPTATQGSYPPRQTTSPPHTTASPSLANGTGTSTISAHSPSPPSLRRGWLSNISSKFSSHTHGGNSESQNPTSPTDKQQPGFLIATLRKFSTPNATGRGAFGRNAGNGHVCSRVIMNKNLTRDRCTIVELDGVKLKKVAFCVDVEVSGPPPLPLKDEEIQKKMRETEKEKEKEERSKVAEVEILKEEPRVDPLKPDKVEEKGLKETTPEGPSDQKVDMVTQGEEGKGEQVASQESGIYVATGTTGSKDTPAAVTVPGVTPSENGVVRPEPIGRRRPTTDVSRIYKRCCQLRETSMLQRMVEQLALANGKTSLILLDLSGHPLHLSDAVVLSDFLALVPITRLDLENCNLSDESLRVILCGLLSVKRPVHKHHHHKASSPSPSSSLTSTLKSARSTSTTSSNGNLGRGVIEWLSLRNNPKIGREGWRYISKFLHMSHSLKALDLSMINLPRPPAVHSPTKSRAQTEASNSTGLFCKALTERLAAVGLDELAMNRCGLNTEQLRCIIEAVHKSGTKRLDLMENNINDDGLIYLAKWIKEGKNCEGLNLSNNDLQQHIDILAASLNENSSLLALSLTNCNLNATSLSSLLPALTVLKNFRLLDLSHNPLLFSTQPDALPLLRRYLPKMIMLKKLQLADTSMTPDHAIALSEILPEIKTLAHFNIMANPLLVPGSAIASPLLPPYIDQTSEIKLSGFTDAVLVEQGGIPPPRSSALTENSTNREGSQEEGAALYTAFVAAVKVSKTIIRLDVDDPGAEAGEVIKALARKVVAFCLRNMDAGTNTDYVNNQADSGSKSGDAEGEEDEEDEYGDEIAKKDDYVVGGTGVVKALGVCLGNKKHCQRAPLAGPPPSMDSSVVLGTGDESGERANEMSKALLLRARKIKERIQPALQRAARGEVEEVHHRKLLFLDDTLYRVISRFEEEYPECRITPPTPHHSHSLLQKQQPQSSLSCLSLKSPSGTNLPSVSLDISTHPYLPTDIDDPDDIDNENQIKVSLSRKASDVSLASKKLEDEEAQMLKMGSYIKKEILKTSALIAPESNAEESHKSNKSDDHHLSVSSTSEVLISTSAQVQSAPTRGAVTPAFSSTETETGTEKEIFWTPPTSPPQTPLRIHDRIKAVIENLDGDELRKHVITSGGADGLISKFEREGKEERRREEEGAEAKARAEKTEVNGE